MSLLGFATAGSFTDLLSSSEASSDCEEPLPSGVLLCSCGGVLGFSFSQY